MTALLAGRERFLAYLRRRLPDPELAEDVLQDSLLWALRSADRLRDEERLLHWFFRILHNAVVDAYRARAARPGDTDIALFEDIEAEPPEELPALCACLGELLPALKPEYAALIRSLELEQAEPALEAARLGITANNLKVRRHRARQALRRRLEETCRVCAEHHCLDCTCGG